MNWKLWGRGLFAAAINGAVAGVMTNFLDPHDFNLATGAGAKKLAVSVFVAGISGMLLYLKQHPTPWDALAEVNGGK